MAITEQSLNRDYITLTDVGLNATPADGYASNKDAVVSDAFPALHLNNKIITAVATIKEAVNGTSADHVTPIIQVSGDGITWTDLYTLEAYSSTAVTLAHAWAMVINLVGVQVPWMRINYVIHTSAHATLSDASTGDIQTVIYTTE